MVAFSTAPDAQTAKSIARHLVENRLAACCNIVPGIQSVYAWEGRICEDEEWLLIIKTHRRCLTRLIREIEKIHPYDVPELVALDIDSGSPNYLNWMGNYV